MALEPPRGTDQQPISKVEWVERDLLSGNSYNPNKVAKPELLLLKVSLLEDGWTEAIVARPDGEIVDGFHRWSLSADPEISAMTDGLVPVVWMKPSDEAHQRMSTIRHNRARGSHYVLRMADIVSELDEMELPHAEIGRRLAWRRKR